MVTCDLKNGAVYRLFDRLRNKFLEKKVTPFCGNAREMSLAGRGHLWHI